MGRILADISVGSRGEWTIRMESWSFLEENVDFLTECPPLLKLASCILLTRFNLLLSFIVVKMLNFNLDFFVTWILRILSLKIFTTCILASNITRAVLMHRLLILCPYALQSWASAEFRVLFAWSHTVRQRLYPVGRYLSGCDGSGWVLAHLVHVGQFPAASLVRPSEVV